MTQLQLSPDRFFGPDLRQAEIARQLYERVENLPLVCPHGHVDPRLFADANYSFGSPTELLIIPDHYVFRMLYSQGVPLEKMGVPTSPPTPSPKGRGGEQPPSPARGGVGGEVETDHRAIWQLFAENFHLFRATPSGMWLNHELHDVFGITEKLDAESGQRIYDQIAEKLATPAFRPRAMFERFNIEVLTTTDAAHDDLHHHKAIRESGWKGRVIPCFRPDGVVNLDIPGWRGNLEGLEKACGREITSYAALLIALEERRATFKQMGATATDHAALTAYTETLSLNEADEIFQRALQGKATAQDATRFTGHMLIEMARMSAEDGLVMQIHVGSYRNHNPQVFERFGLDKGCDIPVQSEFTRNLKPLLDRHGNNNELTIILFNLDETTYSRELSTLAGHYPALRLGPPWWFHDSPNGMARYFDQIVETAGLYNTVGFNDDTRAFPSIPARHDVWRRVAANWLAGMVARGMVELDDAEEMIVDVAVRLVKKAYRL